jgi:hypothetical protein
LLLASLLPTASLSTEAGIFLPLQNNSPESVEVLKFLSDPMIKRFKVVRIDVDALVATFDQDGEPTYYVVYEGYLNLIPQYD